MRLPLMLVLLALPAVAQNTKVQIYDGTNAVSTTAVTSTTRALKVDCINCTGGGSSSAPSVIWVDGGVISANQGSPGVAPWLVGDGAGAMTVDGTVTVGNSSLAVTGPLTDAQLRASAISVNVSNTAAVTISSGSVTVSGAVTVSDGTGALTVDGTIAATQSGPWTVSVTDGAGALTVDGTVAISGTVPVSGPLTDTQLRATDLPVALTSSDQVTIANTSIPVTDNGGSLTVDGTVSVSGTVTTSGTTTATISNTAANTSAVAVRCVNAAGSAFESCAGGGSSGGGLTDAELRASDVGVALTSADQVTIANASLAVTGTFWPATQPVSGTVTATGPLTNTELRASAVPVSGTFFQATQPVSGTVTVGNASLAVTGTFFQATQPVSLAANQSVNQTQVNGVAVSVGKGIVDPGTQRVISAQSTTYSAGTTAKTATAAGVGPFFSICGSATKTVRVQRFSLAGTVATAAIYGDVVLKKTSTATSAGTATTLTNAPHDSASSAATAVAKYYTVLGTAGTSVGVLEAKGAVFPITATVSTVIAQMSFLDLNRDPTEPIVLRGTTQCMEANFGTTPTNAPTLQVSVTWTEE